MMSKPAEKRIRYILATLLLVVAVNAFGGGYYALAGAPGVPTAWLIGSPFRNYFIPGLILFVVIGGLCSIAAIAVFRQHRLADKLSFIAVTIIFIWLTVQVIIIGYVSWMQPVTALAALLILILTFLLPKQE